MSFSMRVQGAGLQLSDLVGEVHTTAAIHRRYERVEVVSEGAGLFGSVGVRDSAVPDSTSRHALAKSKERSVGPLGDEAVQPHAPP